MLVERDKLIRVQMRVDLPQMSYESDTLHIPPAPFVGRVYFSSAYGSPRRWLLNPANARRKLRSVQVGWRQLVPPVTADSIGRSTR